MTTATALHESVLWHARHRPGAPAVATPNVRLTYLDLAERASELSSRLVAAGLRPGDRVTIALPNVPATVVAGLALGMVGATSVEVNRAWGVDILGQVLRSSGSRHLFMWSRDVSRWAAALQGVDVDAIWMVHPGVAPWASLSSLVPWVVTCVQEDGLVDPSLPPVTRSAPYTPDPDSAALILFTSGSTGVPQGVIQTVRNIDANTRSIVSYLGLTQADRAMVTLPLYYCYGRSVMQTHLAVGGSLFLDNRFALPRVVLEAMADEQCTGFAGVPLTFEILRRQVDMASMSWPRLRYVTQAGGAMSADTTEWARAAFAPAELYVMYGQTEATARLSYLPPAKAIDKQGSIGIPISGVEMRVVDEDGVPVPDGELGNLIAQGDNVTPGYLDRPEETAIILRDGWLWTGDLAVRDEDGYFFHRGRAREILKIGGHRVSPVEIEQILTTHPDVTEAAVCGAPDALMGEVAVAFVVPRTGAPELADLPRYAQERLPSYQVPVEFVRVDALPRSESGKLLRTELAQRMLDRRMHRDSGGMEAG